MGPVWEPGSARITVARRVELDLPAANASTVHSAMAITPPRSLDQHDPRGRRDGIEGEEY